MSNTYTTALPLNLNLPRITLKDVIAEFKVSRSTVYRWMKAGILPKHKLGNRVCFYREDVEAAIPHVCKAA
jgi:excisionase family DNA binding protein